MRKAIKSTLKQVNSKITSLMIDKSNLLVSKPKKLTDDKERDFNTSVWNIEKDIRELKTQKRALTSLLIGTL